MYCGTYMKMKLWVEKRIFESTDKKGGWTLVRNRCLCIKMDTSKSRIFSRTFIFLDPHLYMTACTYTDIRTHTQT